MLFFLLWSFSVVHEVQDTDTGGFYHSTSFRNITQWCETVEKRIPKSLLLGTLLFQFGMHNTNITIFMFMHSLVLICSLNLFAECILYTNSYELSLPVLCQIFFIKQKTNRSLHIEISKSIELEINLVWPQDTLRHQNTTEEGKAQC